MKIFLSILIFLFASCKEKNIIWDGKNIAMPEYYRKITGYDSIQLIFGGRATYNEAKKDFDVTWDSLYANFCYPNEWEFEKWKKPIHDTVYLTEWKIDATKILNVYTVYDTLYKP